MVENLRKQALANRTKHKSRVQLLMNDLGFNLCVVITNGHLLICDGCFRILKGSKMRSLDSDKRCC